MDTAFIDALKTGFAQIVLLGAGFDTRALRFADLNHGTQVFELDKVATQKPKVEILQRKKVKIPAKLTYVPIDFERESLFEVLSKAGFQEGKKSLFLWEGVTMYLSSQAVDNTLDFIRHHSASGSLVAFDYIFASVLRRENRSYGESEAFETISRTGEGWTFGLEEKEIEPFLLERGFEAVAHYTPQELEKMYLTTENGESLGRVNGTHCIVIALVK
jgi:methyltransferase (TIGR00027 family)